ncbi:hypothetical protein [Helicobacter rodentium]|uniref:hypothetical protein n=1 Tax=Helicobacter rodentium TaxID=59617 RepID=UPI0023F00DA7|nr:hypothetical protein [Helicobacter rodentium]
MCKNRFTSSCNDCAGFVPARFCVSGIVARVELATHTLSHKSIITRHFKIPLLNLIFA